MLQIGFCDVLRIFPFSGKKSDMRKIKSKSEKNRL